jgi:uncharacterized protein YktB (UPF0637 family)
MATLGFLRRDFEVFAIDDVDTRLAKIDELVTPRLMDLVAQINPKLARRIGIDLYPRYARHSRRAANTPGESWAAWSPSRDGYRRHPYLALSASRVGVHARIVVNASVDERATIARAVKSHATELGQSFHGTRIQNYDGWDCRTMPKSVAADRGFFDALGDTLAKKSGSVDVGFGWPARDALQIDLAEVLDAFGELAPLFRTVALR